MLWEKKKAPVVETGYPKLIVAIKRTNGQTYYSEAAPMTLPHELSWAVNDLCAEKFYFTRANVGDALTAYYVNNSTELSSFPSSGHTVTDAVWSISMMILEGYDHTMKHPIFPYITRPLKKCMELSTYAGERTSISWLENDFSYYLSVLQAYHSEHGGTGTLTGMTGGCYVSVTSPSLGIEIDYPIGYDFLI